MNTNGRILLTAMGNIDMGYVQEAAEASGRKERPWARYFSIAACLGLALLGALRLGAAPWGNKPPVIDPPPMVVSEEPKNTDQPPVESDTLSPVQPPEPQKVTINWGSVVVNEAEGLGADATRLYMDPALYEAEHWDMDQVREYFGWELAPAYIPEDLTGGGQGVGLTVYRDKATGELIEDQAGRGFWVDFYEDGSPKSDDDIVIPKGFMVRASRLGILHCALLPVDDAQTTDFGGVPVTISHCSMKHGPFDPTQKAPDGLSNMPAGYYDIYVAAFELDGVEYEVEAQRMELEELIKIVASIIKPYEDISVGAGCGMP